MAPRPWPPVTQPRDPGALSEVEVADKAPPEEGKIEPAPVVDEPAASEEGVIGAYQVGETQFTMFADGSIHARTPDGDYVFASMDELKAYLASEKDKLGA